jgi:hypothetical protein
LKNTISSYFRLLEWRKWIRKSKVGQFRFFFLKCGAIKKPPNNDKTIHLWVLRFMKLTSRINVQHSQVGFYHKYIYI